MAIEYNSGNYNVEWMNKIIHNSQIHRSYFNAILVILCNRHPFVIRITFTHDRNTSWRMQSQELRFNFSCIYILHIYNHWQHLIGGTRIYVYAVWMTDSVAILQHCDNGKQRYVTCDMSYVTRTHKPLKWSKIIVFEYFRQHFFLYFTF